MVTGRPSMTRKMLSKSPRCMGRMRASAARRSASESERIICRTAMMRSGSKNMCSVRHRPMPSAPKARAVFASIGVSALVRTCRVRAASTHFMSVAKSSSRRAGTSGMRPSSTSPDEPSTVMTSPSLNAAPAARMTPVR